MKLKLLSVFAVYEYQKLSNIRHLPVEKDAIGNDPRLFHCGLSKPVRLRQLRHVDPPTFLPGLDAQLGQLHALRALQ
jgi:hypothetical protein